MTSWTPQLDHRPGPRYRAIAESLAADIAAGRLAAGARLPTHRELAWRLGLTVGTVTRAYAEAERRGLIAGEVGRGTYVRGAAPADLGLTLAAPEPAIIDLSVNFPIAAGHHAMLARGLRALADRDDLLDHLPYHPHAGRPADRAAGAAWLTRAGLDVPPEEVVVTAGGQHAILAALAAVAASGDTVLVEDLTYPGVKAAASLLGIRLVAVAMDGHGVVPAAVAQLCRGVAAKALYCMPTLHNPTNVTMPEERRRAVAETAVAHGLAIIEDDAYGFLVAQPPAPIAALGLADTVYLTTLSKCLAAGYRVGYVQARGQRLERVVQAVRATAWMASPLTASLASTWISDGTMERLARERRSEAAVRHAMVAEAFAGQRMETHPTSYHAWLHLPEPWQAGPFVAEARRRGVAVTPPATFVVSRQSAPEAVRVCYGAASNRDDLTRGLRILADLLGEGPDAAAPAVV